MFSLPFKKSKNSDAVYEEKKIFDSEGEVFFGRLRRALPNCYIFPKVELNSLLDSVNRDPKEKKAEQDDLQGKQVDFAIFDASLGLLCVVELCRKDAEGRYRSYKKYFESAGIKTVRWDRDMLPNFEQILRTLAPFSSLASPKPDVATSTIMRTELEQGRPANVDTVQAIYKAHPVPSNIQALSIIEIEHLTPDGFLKNKFPHIWQRVCLFCNEPAHLKRYLASLSVQDRGEKRAGFPREALIEISAIAGANERYIQRAEPRTAWHTDYVNR
jgi:hypothetical protein